MHRLWALIWGEGYWRAHSFLIKVILQSKGIRVGKNFKTHGVPYLKIRGRAADIVIGNNVSILGDIDIRNREQGKIVIEDGVVIDDNCRFVSANQAVLTIGKNTIIGRDTILNCGTDVTIHPRCLFSSRIYINSSDHIITGQNNVVEQGYIHAPVVIEEGVFIGGGVSIKMGVTVGRGAVVGANAVVTHDVPPYAVCAGVPAKIIKMRA